MNAESRRPSEIDLHSYVFTKTEAFEYETLLSMLQLFTIHKSYPDEPMPKRLMLLLLSIKSIWEIKIVKTEETKNLQEAFIYSIRNKINELEKQVVNHGVKYEISSLIERSPLKKHLFELRDNFPDDFELYCPDQIENLIKEKL